MACTGCQNVTTQSWTFWSQFCDQVYVTQYPETIPQDTAVPHWAFVDYTVRSRYGDGVMSPHLTFLVNRLPTSLTLRPQRPPAIRRRCSHQFLRLFHYLAAPPVLVPHRRCRHYRLPRRPARAEKTRRNHRTLVPSLEVSSVVWLFWRRLVPEFGFSSADVRPHGMMRTIKTIKTTPGTPLVLPCPTMVCNPHKCDFT